jgi:ATP-dependent DNA helicase RecG
VGPLDDLLRSLDAPLTYLADVPPARARGVLPRQALEVKITHAAGATDDADVHAALDELRTLVVRLADVDSASAVAAHTANVVRARALVARLRGAGSVAPAVGPPARATPRAPVRPRGGRAFAVSAPPAPPTPPAPPGAARYVRTPGPLAPRLEALRMPVQFVKGVGPRRATQLAEFGLATVEDLLFHLPFRYEDRRHVGTIDALQAGAVGTVVAELVSVQERWMGRGRRRALQATARDATGVLDLAWFHQLHFFRTRLQPGQQVLLHGRVDTARAGGLRMTHPELVVLEGDDEAEIGHVVPIYEKPTGISVGAMRRLVHSAVEYYAAQVPSALPASVVAARGVCDLDTALRTVHQPDAEADVEALNRGAAPGHRAIVYDELFYLQLGMALRRANVARESGIAFPVPAAPAQELVASLPFALTGAQARVVAEIERDMAAPHPMHRLIQGDVGSGKTVVALYAATIAVAAGYQVALMAPTELLAEQHCRTLRTLGAAVGVRVALLTGTVQGKLRGRTARAIARGDVDLVVGTHALIQEGIAFKQLGLGIIDEQHRFGVRQRASLKHHGTNPDILLMTATPIPRTLALTCYGDLDVSALDELPPGRQPITTRVFHERQRERVLTLVRRELDAGRQAYIVCPLVEESEKSDLKDATTMARELGAGPLAGYRLALVHGQMRPEQKDEVMRGFREGAHQVLVCTTVVEVGIDVPNATVMVVEHAEHFGLAQLHQLRGRVGRGAHRSLCLLVAAYARGDQARQRLRVMEETGDGFRIAERDLELRGPGEFLGTRQSGLPDFRAANLLRDADLLRTSHADAAAWLAADPGLHSPEAATVREALEARWAGRLELARVG